MYLSSISRHDSSRRSSYLIGSDALATCKEQLSCARFTEPRKHGPSNQRSFSCFSLDASMEVPHHSFCSPSRSEPLSNHKTTAPSVPVFETNISSSAFTNTFAAAYGTFPLAEKSDQIVAGPTENKDELQVKVQRNDFNHFSGYFPSPATRETSSKRVPLASPISCPQHSLMDIEDATVPPLTEFERQCSEITMSDFSGDDGYEEDPEFCPESHARSHLGIDTRQQDLQRWYPMVLKAEKQLKNLPPQRKDSRDVWDDMIPLNGSTQALGEDFADAKDDTIEWQETPSRGQGFYKKGRDYSVSPATKTTARMDSLSSFGSSKRTVQNNFCRSQAPSTLQFRFQNDLCRQLLLLCLLLCALHPCNLYESTRVIAIRNSDDTPFPSKAQAHMFQIDGILARPRANFPIPRKNQLQRMQTSQPSFRRPQGGRRGRTQFECHDENVLWTNHLLKPSWQHPLSWMKLVQERCADILWWETFQLHRWSRLGERNCETMASWRCWEEIRFG